MADNIDVSPGSGKTIRADEVGGALYQVIKPAFGVDGSATLVSATDPLPVTIADAAVTVDGTVAATGDWLTDTELRASAVPVSDGGASLTVDGSLTVAKTTVAMTTVKSTT